LGKVDYYDLMCIWNDKYVDADVWYRILNLGYRIPIAAGTDAMTDFWRAPTIGSVRVYAHSGSPLDYQTWIEALKSGKTFVTNGPLLSLKVGDAEPGGVVEPAESTSKVHVEADAVSVLPFDSLDIIQNGKVVGSVRPTDSLHARFSGDVSVERSGWIAARAAGSQKQHLLVDSSVYAHTSPVYVQKGNHPVRSVEDAKYFVKWIDRILQLMDKRNAFDSGEQKKEVRDIYLRAREIFEQKATGK
jgi:TolB protein